jgi:DNA topoisomerase IB
MTPEQRRDFLAFSYLRNKEARVGNFAYFNQSLGRTGKKRLVNV